MKVSKDSKVTIHYSLRDESGEVLDSSKEREPLEFIQGAGQIIPGMENALEGRSPGEEFSVVVEPEDGYGKRDESLVYKVSREHFEGIDPIELGMRFQVNAGKGAIMTSVAGLEDDGVILDGNHPLADMRLFFEVSVLDVREASKGELQGCGDCTGCSCGED